MHTRCLERRDPRAVAAETRPTRAAHRQHGHGRRDAGWAVRRLEDQRSVFAEAPEYMTQPHLDSEAREPAQPRAQKRRGLEALGEHASAGADERLLTEAGSPFPQIDRRERLDMRTQSGLSRPVARQEQLLAIAVGQVQPAAPGHQELASERWHA